MHWQYHAWKRSRPDRPRRDLIRYDTNPHRPWLHVHIFNAQGQELEIQPVADDDMPTLDAFIRHAVALAS